MRLGFKRRRAERVEAPGAGQAHRRATSDTRRTTARALGTGALLVLVVAAPAVASGQGLYAFGRDVVGLSDGWAALPWLVLDVASAYAAVLSFRDVAKGDSAIVNRALVWAYTLLSAGLNLWSHGPTAGLFYGAASVSAALLWDRTLRGTRRDLLRSRGAVAAPTPRFRAARWLVALPETASAWRLAVINEVTDPAEAVALARHARRNRRHAKATATAATRAARAGVAHAPELDEPAAEPADDEAPTPEPVAPLAELAGLSTAAAVRKAFEALGTRDKAPVVRWLAVRGVDVAPSYVRNVAARADAAEAREQRKDEAAEPTGPTGPTEPTEPTEPTGLTEITDAATEAASVREGGPLRLAG